MLSRVKSDFKDCCNYCINYLINRLSDYLSDYVMNRSNIIAYREANYSAMKSDIEI